MIIRNPPKLTNREGVNKYIEVDLWSWLRELSTGLLRINFNDNFQSFIVRNVSIPAGTEVPISNQLSRQYPGFVPSGRIIVRQTGDANIIDGPTPWTAKTLYLMNPSANDAVVSVIFFI
jgi:hypothetical protein